jgi:hypothetical protein
MILKAAARLIHAQGHNRSVSASSTDSFRQSRKRCLYFSILKPARGSLTSHDGPGESPPIQEIHYEQDFQEG